MQALSERIIAEIIPATIHGVKRHGIEVLLVRREERPNRKWLKEQVDMRMREHESALWWGAIPLTGGYVLVPEPLLRYLRHPTYEDLTTAVDHANNHGRKTIAELFPDLLKGIKEHEGL